jgi:hypothetical protein
MLNEVLPPSGSHASVMDGGPTVTVAAMRTTERCELDCPQAVRNSIAPIALSKHLRRSAPHTGDRRWMMFVMDKRSGIAFGRKTLAV